MTEQNDSVSLPPGISQREVAEEIGISISTVSRVLSGHDRVSRRTVEDVRRAIATLQDRRDGVATASLTDNLIGLTTSHVSEAHTSSQLNQITGQVLGGAESAASRLGYRVYTARDSSLLLDPRNRRFLESLSGLILAGGLISEHILQSAIEAGVPTVIVGGHVPGSVLPSVGAQNQQGFYALVQHLVELGHERIALVNGPTATYTSHEKLAGYLTAHLHAGLRIDQALVAHFDAFGGFDTPDANAIIDRLLELPEPPTAILGGTDDIAMDIVALLRQRGLSVPADVSVSGFQDDDIATSMRPRLTTIRIDRIAWGEQAVEKVVAIANGTPMRGDRLLLPIELIVRESTARRKA